MGLRLVTPPNKEPLSLEEAKEQCRVTHSAEDALIEAYVSAARRRCEDFQRRAWLSQTWELTLDRFPCVTDRNPFAAILIPRPPLQQVTSVKYVGLDGVEQTLDPSLYRVDSDSEPGRITPAYDTSWPSTRSITNAVRIRYVAGYADLPSLPKSWVQALRLEVGHYNLNRESVVTGTIVTAMRSATEALLGPDQIDPMLFADQ